MLALGIGLTGLAVDQLVKDAAIANLPPGQPVDVLGSFLRFTLIRNPGAAFSLGTSFTVVLSIFAIIALAACLAVGLPRVRTTWQGAVLGLLIAGISGNLFDRLFREPGPLRGHVVDLFQLPRFAIFNVADIFITVAAALVIILSLVHDRQREEPVPAEAS